MNLGGLLAAFELYVLASRASRRVRIQIACAIGVIAIPIQVGSKTEGALYAGRLVLCISNGFYLTFSVRYIKEIAPAHLRGSVAGLVILHSSLGALFGILADNCTNFFSSGNPTRFLWP